MKTGKELILELPNGVRRNFILELGRMRSYKLNTMFLNEKYQSLEQLIRTAFWWTKSEKGHSYWENICNTYA
jgi:hypothetical protein